MCVLLSRTKIYFYPWSVLGADGLPRTATRFAPGSVYAHRWRAGRVISDCHFSVRLNHFIPSFLPYSVAVFLKWQSDITLRAGDLLLWDNEALLHSASPTAAYAEGEARAAAGRGAAIRQPLCVLCGEPLVGYTGDIDTGARGSDCEARPPPLGPRGLADRAGPARRRATRRHGRAGACARTSLSQPHSRSPNQRGCRQPF